MDPVQLRVEAEVSDALREVNKLRADYLKFQAVYTKSLQDLSNLTNKLSGDAAVRAAAQYVQAIKNIGGVGKLTEQEQARANKVLTEAADKYRALGRVVPEEMQKIINATANAGKKIKDSLTVTISGQKIAAEASKITQAIERIGGVSRLTSKEAANAFKVLDQAIQKSAAMGEQVPKNIQRVWGELKAVVQDTSRAMQQISGQKAIREADAYVRAVGKIGGVSKLTETEQRKVNKVLSEAADKYRRLGQEVPKEYQKIINATRDATTKQASMWDGMWKQIMGGVTAGTLLANAITGIFNRAIANIQRLVGFAAKTFVDLLNRGNEVNKIEVGFRRLAGTVRDTAGVQQKWNEVLDAARKGTRGLVTDVQLMLAANRGILLGLPITAKEFGMLTDAAFKLGRAMGLETTQAIQDLTIALGRTSPRILDNLGIMVKIAEANQVWADKTGIRVRQMTQEQKTIAFYQFALQKIADRVKDIGDIQLTLSERLKIVNVGIDNFKNNLGAAINLSAPLNKALELLADRIFGAFSGTQEEQIIKIVRLVDSFAIGVVKTARAVVLASMEMIRAFDDVRSAISSLLTSMTEDSLKLLKLMRALAVAAAAIPGPQQERLKGIRDIIIGVDDALMKIRKSNQLAASAIGPTLKGLDKAQEFLGNLAVEMEKTQGRQLTIHQVQKALLDQQEKNTEKSEKLSEKERKAQEKRTKAFAKVVEDLKRLEVDMQNSGQTLLAVLSNTWFKAPQQLIREEFITFGKLMRKGWEKLLEDLRRLETGTAQGFIDPGIFNVGQKFDLKSWMEMEAKAADVHDKFKNFGRSLNDIVRSFTELNQIVDGPMNKIIEGVGKILALMNVGTKIGAQLKDSFTQLGKSFKFVDGDLKAVDWKNFAQGAANASMAVVAGIGAMNEATSVAGKKNRVLGGMATGASIGGKILPGWGHVIGAAVGALVGALRKIHWEREMERIGREWGINISEGLAKELERSAKEEFAGDFVAASIANMDKIIAEGGGVTAKNFNQLLGKLRDSFSMLDTGKFTVEQTREVLDKNFGLFAAHLEKTGQLATREFLEIMELNKRMGVESEAIQQFIESQIARWGQALSEIGAPMAKESEKLTTRMQEIQDRLAELRKEGEKEAGKGKDFKLGLSSSERREFDKLSAEYDKHLKKLGKYKGEVKDLGFLITAAFSKGRLEGMSLSEIYDSLGPAIDQLIPAYQKLKESGVDFNNTLLDTIIKERELANKFPELLQASKAGNEMALAMSNLGELTVENFASLERVQLRNAQRMREVGFTNESVIREMLPFIRTAKEAWEKFGIPIDEATKKMIAQAEQMGLNTDKVKTDSEIMTDGFNGVALGLATLIELMGGEVPEALKKMADAAIESAAKVDEVAEAAAGVGLEFNEAGERARDVLNDIIARTKEAKTTVDQLSFGSSPGGIKEIPIQFGISQKAVKDFERDALHRIKRIKNSVDEMQRMKIPDTRFLRGEGRHRIPTDPSPLPDSLASRVWKDRIKIAAPTVPSMKVEKGAVNISTWHLGKEQELISEVLGPALLRYYSQGGAGYSHFDSMVSDMVKRQVARTK
jgi:chemotaxis regulatin CheY-phosphate phosphatase CheZ